MKERIFVFFCLTAILIGFSFVAICMLIENLIEWIGEACLNAETRMDRLAYHLSDLAFGLVTMMFLAVLLVIFIGYGVFTCFADGNWPHGLAGAALLLPAATVHCWHFTRKGYDYLDMSMDCGV